MHVQDTGARVLFSYVIFLHFTSQLQGPAARLDSLQLGGDLIGEEVGQQEGQQVLQLPKVILQRRARQHDAPPAVHRQPAPHMATC